MTLALTEETFCSSKFFRRGKRDYQQNSVIGFVLSVYSPIMYCLFRIITLLAFHCLQVPTCH